MKTCSNCQGEIQDAAVICRHCRAAVVPPAGAAANPVIPAAPAIPSPVSVATTVPPSQPGARAAVSSETSSPVEVESQPAPSSGPSRRPPWLLIGLGVLVLVAGGLCIGVVGGGAAALGLTEAAKPAVAHSIRLEAAEGTARSMEPQALPKATVLDASGSPLNPQPEVEWSSAEPDVATVTGGAAVPRGDGQVALTARAGEVTAEYQFVVILPDSAEPVPRQTLSAPATPVQRAAVAPDPVEPPPGSDPPKPLAKGKTVPPADQVAVDFKVWYAQYAKVRPMAEQKLATAAESRGYDGIKDVDTQSSCSLVYCIVHATGIGTKK